MKPETFIGAFNVRRYTLGDVIPAQIIYDVPNVLDELNQTPNHTTIPMRKCMEALVNKGHDPKDASVALQFHRNLGSIIMEIDDCDISLPQDRYNVEPIALPLGMSIEHKAILNTIEENIRLVA